MLKCEKDDGREITNCDFTGRMLYGKYEGKSRSSSSDDPSKRYQESDLYYQR